MISYKRDSGPICGAQTQTKKDLVQVNMILSPDDGLFVNLTDNKGSFQKLLSGFGPLRGSPPPPTPLTENHFAKKTLAERGVHPPPLMEKRQKIV